MERWLHLLGFAAGSAVILFFGTAIVFILCAAVNAALGN